MLNVIKASITDLMRSTYDDAFCFNADKSGFVMDALSVKGDMVFYPKHMGNHESMYHLKDSMVSQLWGRSLVYNVIPFLFAFVLTPLSIFLLSHYHFLNMPITVFISILVFFMVLYVAKVSLRIIGDSVNYSLLLNDQFSVLRLQEFHGKYSTIEDKCRAREYTSIVHDSEILAHSFIVEDRMTPEQKKQLPQ